MHSAGLELTKLTYTMLEDNLIRHRGDRIRIFHTVVREHQVHTIREIACRGAWRIISTNQRVNAINSHANERPESLEKETSNRNEKKARKGNESKIPQ